MTVVWMRIEVQYPLTTNEDDTLWDQTGGGDLFA